MRFLILTSTQFALPAIDLLFHQSFLGELAFPERVSDDMVFLRTWAESNHISYTELTQSDLEGGLRQLLEKGAYDAVIVFGFPWRIPAGLLSVPPQGFFNIHFSLLPAYKGPDPVFWQLRNGETNGGITIQRMNDRIDEGEILMQQQLPFMAGETWGICQRRYSMVAREMISEFAGLLSAGAELPKIAETTRRSSYYKKLTAGDLVIDWEKQRATEIENLVNAANPNAGGAITFLRQQTVKLLEVSPVDGKNEQPVPAGTIIHTDVHGIFVQCVDGEILKINILNLTEGILTGAKLAALGIQKGERFHQHTNNFSYQ